MRRGLQIGQNSVGSIHELMLRSCGMGEVPYVASSEKPAILPKTSAMRGWPRSIGGAGARSTARPRGTCREAAPGAAEKYIASLALYGALRADLDPRYQGSRSAPNVAYTRDMGVGFFGLASQ